MDPAVVGTFMVASATVVAAMFGYLSHVRTTQHRENKALLASVVTELKDLNKEHGKTREELVGHIKATNTRLDTLDRDVRRKGR